MCCDAPPLSGACLWTMIDDHVTTMRFATRAELLVPFDRQTRLGEDVSPDVL